MSLGQHSSVPLAGDTRWTMQDIRRRLKRFPLLVRTKKAVWRALKLTNEPRACRDPHYFRRIFEAHSGYNRDSIDLSRGLARGRFRGVDYLLKMRPGNVIETDVFLNKVWEPHIVELIASYLGTPGQAMLDIGANVGAVSIPLAKAQPEARFYLFEPHPGVFADLKDNCSYNRLANVELVNAAVSNRGEPTVKLYAQKPSSNMGLSSLTRNPDIREHDVIEVGNVKVDDFAAGCREPIAVIKIDTQGTELDVLLSARQTLARHRPVVFFEFESEYFASPDEEARARAGIVQLFGALDYEIFFIHQICDFMPLATLRGYYCGDIVAVPSAQK